MLKGRSSERRVEVDKAVKSGLDIGPIKVFIESCIKDVVGKGLVDVSLRGGYYDVPDPKSDFDGDVPHYFHLGDVNFPSEDDIIDQFSLYVEDELVGCLNNFDTFRVMGFGFDVGEVSVVSSLGVKVNVDVTYPITVKRAGSSTLIDDTFRYSEMFNFNRLYGILDSIRVEQEEDMDSFPTAYLATLSSSRGFTYDIEDLGEETYIYTLTFNDLLDTSLDFRFAGKY